MKFYRVIDKDDRDLDEVGVVIGETFYWCMKRYEGDIGESHFEIDGTSFCWGFLESDYVTDSVHEVYEIRACEVTSNQMACLIHSITWFSRMD